MAVYRLLSYSSTRLWTHDEQAAFGAFVELRNPQGILPEQFLNDAERKVALFNVDDLWRPSEATTQRHKICIRRNDRAVIVFGPLPDLFVGGLSKTDVSHRLQSCWKRKDSIDHPRRNFEVEQKQQLDSGFLGCRFCCCSISCSRCS